MSVTKRKVHLREEKRNDLALLVDFLNLDFNSLSWEDFKRKNLRTTIFKGSLITGEISEVEHPEEEFNLAREIQSELKSDLFPIAAWREIPEKLYPYEERWDSLKDKLNRMGFKRRWTKVEKEDATGKFNKWIFKGWIPYFNERERWYGPVASFMESGDLERLRQCPICRDFFAAKRIDGHFCSPECKTEYDKKHGAERVRNHREKKRKRQKKIELERREKMAFDQFSVFINLAQKSYSVPPPEVINKLKKIGEGNYLDAWKRVDIWINQIKNGSSKEEVWKGFSKEEKEFFE